MVDEQLPPPNRPPTEPESREADLREERIRLEAHSILAASIGSVIGAAVSSRFGLAGTFLGAALAPVFVMFSVQALGPSIERSLERSRRGLTRPEGLERARQASWRWALRHPRDFFHRVRRLRRRQVIMALSAAAGAFLVAMVAITAIEALVGRPINRIGHHGGGGTTLAPKGSSKTPTIPTNTTTQPQPRTTTVEKNGGTKVPPPATTTPTTPTQAAPSPTTPSLLPTVPQP